MRMSKQRSNRQKKSQLFSIRHKSNASSLNPTIRKDIKNLISSWRKKNTQKMSESEKKEKSEGWKESWRKRSQKTEEDDWGWGKRKKKGRTNYEKKIKTMFHVLKTSKTEITQEEEIDKALTDLSLQRLLASLSVNHFDSLLDFSRSLISLFESGLSFLFSVLHPWSFLTVFYSLFYSFYHVRARFKV